MKSSRSRFLLPAALGVTALLAATAAPAPTARAEKIILLANGNRLVTVDSATPGTVQTVVNVTGLAANENLLGIDIRPANGVLVGLGSTSRLYNVNAATGVATAIGAGPFTPALSGTIFGFDFNPTVDRIRLVSDTRQDLRLNPDTGGVAFVDGQETFGPNDPNASVTPVTTGAAYSNNGPNATVTVLYVLETSRAVFTVQNPPNNGTLITVGPLGIPANVPSRGFDISNATERGYANFTINNVPTLFSVNLMTGATASLGALPTTAGGTAISGYLGLTVPFPNASSRQAAGAFVTRQSPLFADFQVGGNELNRVAGSGSAVRVLIRGLGPTLGGLANPRLRVFDSAGTQIATNDDFGTNADAAAITASGFAPPNASEPALILTLQPGNYSARLSPRRPGDAGGNARIEIFELR